MLENKLTTKMTNKIMLIACGSYNPPTPMHLRMFGKFFLPLRLKFCRKFPN